MRTRSMMIVLIAVAASVAAEDVPDAPPALPSGPDFQEVLSLESVGGPRIAPDGGAVAYEVTTTDWEENRYDTEIWLAPDGGEPFALTRTEKGSSSGPRWSPDGRWIAFLADRGDGRQVWVIRARGGEARPLTAVEGGVGDFEWSPTGEHMALALLEPESEEKKKRQERYGAFAVEDERGRLTHLWLLDVAAAQKTRDGVERPAEGGGVEKGDDAPAEGETDDEAEDEEAEEEEGEEGEENADDGSEGDERDDRAGDEGSGDGDDGEAASALRRLTGGEAYTVDAFRFSPDGRAIAFSHRPEPDVTATPLSDLSVVDVATGEVRPLVTRAGFDCCPYFSPDGEWIVFVTHDGEGTFYENRELAKIPAAGGEITVLTADFDAHPSIVAWLDDGIRFLASVRTESALFRLDPETGETTRLTTDPPIVREVDVTPDGRRLAFVAEAPGRLAEIYRTAAEPWEPEPVTAMTDQVAGWPLGRREVIEWQSRDGTPIEGVLWLPPDFDPAKRHPLLVLIHGGPAATSRPRLVSAGVYPVQQWLARGALILEPNYRGSSGYGEAFRAKNVRNLGVGDAWDVLSGVDHLIERGIADPERLGAMGWSQGGYISAFLATTSDRFKAISVGAGISNWTTYYVNTDIHPFTRHYLEATPWDDPEIYAKTSPIAYVKDAKTPTLIQHGENDRRVPIPNAYELYQGLRDHDVPVRLLVYKDFGHGISRPKERLAAVWHNWQWFAKYLWGEDVELPLD